MGCGWMGIYPPLTEYRQGGTSRSKLYFRFTLRRGFYIRSKNNNGGVLDRGPRRCFVFVFPRRAGKFETRKWPTDTVIAARPVTAVSLPVPIPPHRGAAFDTTVDRGRAYDRGALSTGTTANGFIPPVTSRNSLCGPATEVTSCAPECVNTRRGVSNA